jgi:hypothetical protein
MQRLICIIALLFVSLSLNAQIAPPNNLSKGSRPIATYTFGKGWATFGLAVPKGGAPQYLKIGALTTQTDVKTRWNDGSIRYAIVSANIPSSGKYAIHADSAGPGGAALTPTWPSASVAFTVSGTTYTATLPAFSGADSWLAGFQVREARVMVTPKTEANTEHPLLQVIFDIRSYLGGGNRVDICTQNVKNTSLMDKVVYDLSISVGGSTVYTKSVYTHYSFTRWRKTFTIGLTEAPITPDFTPFIQTRVIPNYRTTINNTVYDSSSSNYDIGGYGGINPYMMGNNVGESVALFPFWTARYTIHKTIDQLAYNLKMGNITGSWPVHLAETDGKTLIHLTDHPNFWFDVRGGPPPDGKPQAAVVSSACFQGSNACSPELGGQSAQPDLEHFPNLSFFPYLITGDRYYLDQCKFWADFAILTVYPNAPTFNPAGSLAGSHQANWARQGAKGIFIAADWPRATAWPLRVTAMASWACPDSDTDKSYFSTIVQNNVDWLGTLYDTALPGGITEALWWEPSINSKSLSNNGVVTGVLNSPWQLAYLVTSIEWCGDQGWTLGHAANLRDRMIRFQIGFIINQPQGYYWNPFPPYPAVGNVTNNGTTLAFYTTWNQVYDNNIHHQFSAGVSGNPIWVGNTYPNPSGQPINTGWNSPHGWAMVNIGVRHGVANASTALNLIKNYQNGAILSTMDSDNATGVGFAYAEENP